MADGIVIFLDLDEYLSKVRVMAAKDEAAFLAPIQIGIRELASGCGLTLARTFADGFLLYREGRVDQDLLLETIDALASFRDHLRSQGFTFKAVVVAGTFVADIIQTAPKASEIALYGPAANFAGKTIGKVPRRCIWIFWTKPDGSEENFDAIALRSEQHWTIPLQDIGRSELIRVGLAAKPDRVDLDAVTARTTFSDSAKFHILETIKLADDKAKSVFAIATALLVYLFNSGAWPKPNDLFKVNSISDLSRLSFLALSVALLSAAALWSMLVLLPRTKGTPTGLFFFGAIASRASAEEYTNAVRRLDASDVEAQLASHNYEVAKVASAKFSSLRWALRLVGLGVATAVVFFGLGWFFSPSSAAATCP